MKPLLYIVLGLTHFAAVGQVEAPSQLTLGIGLTGRHVEDRTLSSQVFGLRILATHDRPWSTSLRTHLQLRSDIEMGTSSTQFSDPYGARQRFQLDEASLTFTPQEMIKLSVGALAHQEWLNPLLVDNKAFVGAREIFKLPLNDFFLELKAEQALVPGNASAVLPALRGTPPTFLMERVRAGYLPRSGFQTTAHVSHFKFSNLSNDLAYEARFLGNTVAGLGKDNNRFAFGFEGVESGLSLGYQSEKDFLINLSLVGLVNLAAAESQAKGFAGSLRSEIPLSGSFTLAPELSFFVVDSDASPSNFSRQAWGHSNRQGFSLAIGGEFPREKMRWLIQYTRASALRPTTYQSDFQFIGAQFGVEYGVL